MLKRTIYCGALRETHIGQDAVVTGWVQTPLGNYRLEDLAREA